MENEKEKLKKQQHASNEIILILNSILNDTSYQPSLCIKGLVKDYLKGEKELLSDLKRKLEVLSND